MCTVFRDGEQNGRHLLTGPDRGDKTSAPSLNIANSIPAWAAWANFVSEAPLHIGDVTSVAKATRRIGRAGWTFAQDGPLGLLLLCVYFGDGSKETHQ